MKKKSIITFIILMFIMICTKVYAADPQIVINTESTVKAGETKTVTVKVTSDTYKVGTITGKIETDAKIEKIKVGDDGEGDTAGLKGWSITYNPTTSLFSAYKASGANDSDVMEFSYTVKAGETGSTSITLSGIELSCLLNGEYTTKNIEKVSKTITIEAEQKEDEGKEEVIKTLQSITIQSKPNKVSYKEGEKFNTEGMKIVANYSDGTSKEVTGYTYSPNGELKEGDSKITISYTEGGVTKTVTQTITVTKEEKEPVVEDEEDKKDKEDKEDKNKGNKQEEDKKDKEKDEDKTTVYDEKLPYTGMGIYLLVGIAIMVIVTYLVYTIYQKKYKDI